MSPYCLLISPTILSTSARCASAMCRGGSYRVIDEMSVCDRLTQLSTTSAISGNSLRLFLPRGIPNAARRAGRRPPRRPVDLAGDGRGRCAPPAAVPIQEGIRQAPRLFVVGLRDNDAARRAGGAHAGRRDGVRVRQDCVLCRCRRRRQARLCRGGSRGCRDRSAPAGACLFNVRPGRPWEARCERLVPKRTLRVDHLVAIAIADVGPDSGRRDNVGDLRKRRQPSRAARSLDGSPRASLNLSIM